MAQDGFGDPGQNNPKGTHRAWLAKGNRCQAVDKGTGQIQKEEGATESPLSQKRCDTGTKKNKNKGEHEHRSTRLAKLSPCEDKQGLAEKSVGKGMARFASAGQCLETQPDGV